MMLDAPAAERNRAPILEVLRKELPSTGLVLEVASGSGLHAVYLARALTPRAWLPTDRAEDALESIEERRLESGLVNLRPAQRLDVTEEDWPVCTADAVVCINMLHIAPWKAAEGLFKGTARLLPEEAPLCTYGPYRFGGEFTAESNAIFDGDLRRRNPAWGVRDVDDLSRLGDRVGLHLAAVHPLPANNHVLVFRRGGSPPR